MSRSVKHRLHLNLNRKMKKHKPFVRPQWFQAFQAIRDCCGAAQNDAELLKKKAQLVSRRVRHGLVVGPCEGSSLTEQMD